MVPGMTDDAGQDPGTGGPAPGWAWDEAEIRRVGYQVVDAIAAHLTGIAARPVFRPFPAELAGSLAQAEASRPPAPPLTSCWPRLAISCSATRSATGIRGSGPG